MGLFSLGSAARRAVLKSFNRLNGSKYLRNMKQNKMRYVH